MCAWRRLYTERARGRVQGLGKHKAPCTLHALPLPTRARACGLDEFPPPDIPRTYDTNRRDVLNRMKFGTPGPLWSGGPTPPFGLLNAEITARGAARVPSHPLGAQRCPSKAAGQRSLMYTPVRARAH